MSGFVKWVLSLGSSKLLRIKGKRGTFQASLALSHLLLVVDEFVAILLLNFSLLTYFALKAEKKKSLKFGSLCQALRISLDSFLTGCDVYIFILPGSQQFSSSLSMAPVSSMLVFYVNSYSQPWQDHVQGN